MNAEEQLKRYYEYKEYPPDSPEYQASLDIYLTLRTMFKSAKIDELDVRIIDLVISGYSYRKTARLLGIDRRSVTARYAKVIKMLEESLK